MEMRKYKDKELSLLGYGCMRFPTKLVGEKHVIDEELAETLLDKAYENGVNYFDTAYPYHEGKSQGFVGKALKKYPRESFNLVTKFPIWKVEKKEDVEVLFNSQLEDCGVEYFDFYLCHAMNKDRIATIVDFEIYNFLKKKKEEGVIKNLGFSFHDTPDVLQTIIDEFEWDFVQLQINYLDWEFINAKLMYEMAVKANLPVIVMEPVRGGALANLCDKSNEMLKVCHNDASIASWAIRYVASLPNVIMILSGMTQMDQVEDNLKTMNNFTPLSDEERKVLANALAEHQKAVTVPCTGCNYCMDCPLGVDIPEVFRKYNRYKLTNGLDTFKNQYNDMDDIKKASSCVSCGACMVQCPQAIEIPDRLGEIDELINELNSK